MPACLCPALAGWTGLEQYGKAAGERKSTVMEIRIEKTACPKEKPGQDNPLVFGTIFTDHMFEMDSEEGGTCCSCLKTPQWRKNDPVIRVSGPQQKQTASCMDLELKILTELCRHMAATVKGN